MLENKQPTLQSEWYTHLTKEIEEQKRRILESERAYVHEEMMRKTVKTLVIGLTREEQIRRSRAESQQKLSNDEKALKTLISKEFVMKALQRPLIGNAI